MLQSWHRPLIFEFGENYILAVKQRRLSVKIWRWTEIIERQEIVSINVKEVTMRYTVNALNIEPDVEELPAPSASLIDGVMESGAWVLAGECSAADRTRLLVDLATAFSRGTEIFGATPAQQKVAYINYSKSAEASAVQLTRNGLEVTTHHPRFIGPNSLHTLIREALPQGGVALVDGIVGSIFGGRKETLEWLEVVLASASPGWSIIVSLPEGLSASKALLNREQRLLRYANLLWVKSEKGQLNLDVRPHNSEDGRFYRGRESWHRSHSRNPINPTEAAIVDLMRRTDGPLTNLQIQNLVEPPAATSSDVSNKVSDRFYKIIQRLFADGGISRHSKADGLYYDPGKSEKDLPGEAPTHSPPNDKPSGAGNETSETTNAPIDGLSDVVKPEEVGH